MKLIRLLVGLPLIVARQRRTIEKLAKQVDQLRAQVADTDAQLKQVEQAYRLIYGRTEAFKDGLKAANAIVQQHESIAARVTNRAEEIINRHNTGWHRILDKLEDENRNLLGTIRRHRHRGYEKPNFTH